MDSGYGEERFILHLVLWFRNLSLVCLQIVLSIIVGVQSIGLLWPGWFIQMWLEWTRRLDAMAVARVAASLDAALLQPFKVTRPRETKKLSQFDGPVGAQIIESTGQDHGGTSRDHRDGVGSWDVALQELVEDISTDGKKGEG